MASMQKSHEERAQSAAADEVPAARQDRKEVSPRGGGILNSVMGAVKGTFSRSGGRGDTTTAAHDSSTTEEGKAKAGGMAGAAMDKAAETKDAAADKAEGAKEYAAEKDASDAAEPEEDVMLRVKAADHMTGQAFNDVGPIGEEGTGMPRRRR